MKRISTGISGLDKLVGGGFIQNSIILLSGGPGTGKTIFGLQFICSNALKEPGVYVTLEQTSEELREQMKQFGMDIERLEDKNKISILQIEEVDIERILRMVESEVKRINAKRLVIDSHTALMDFASTFKEGIRELSSYIIYLKETLGFGPGEREIIRKTAKKTIDFYKKLGCTTLLISEVSKEGEFSKDGVTEYLVDGIISLNFLSEGFPRSLNIRKMRRTKHGLDAYPVEISKEGLIVKKSPKI